MLEVEIAKMINPEVKISDLNESDLRIDTFSCGFKSLDDLLFLKKNEGELIIIGGRPSQGKSSLMFDLAFNVALDLPVYVASLEMSAKSILRRRIAAHINRPLSAIQIGAVDPRIINEALQEMKKYKLYVDDRSGLDVYTLCDSIKSANKKYSLGLVVVDYLQLLRVNKGHSSSAEVAEVTSALKGLSKDLKIPIIVGSQLSRACETRGQSSGKFRPILSDLRDSGSIEQDADIVAFVHREYRYTGQNPDKAEIIIAKNRNGPIADIEMKFIATQTKFVDIGVSSDL